MLDTAFIGWISNFSRECSKPILGFTKIVPTRMKKTNSNTSYIVLKKLHFYIWSYTQLHYIPTLQCD